MTPRHQHHHDLIAERFAAYTRLPRRSGLDKIRRREAGKKAWHTLTGHLRGEHLIRGQSPFLAKTYEEVDAWHRGLHEEED